ncbi:M28 family metallopeptidase [soil metagenome]
MNRAILAASLAFAACAPPVYRTGHTAAWISDVSTLPTPIAPAELATVPPSTSTQLSPPLATYADTALRIIDAARAYRGAYEKLTQLTDTIGARLSGSKQLDEAIVWAVASFRAAGFPVHTERVMVPHWVRNTAEAALTAPISRSLMITALGGSVATPKAGITAPVVVVTSFDDLESKRVQLKGAIVLFDVPLPAYSDENHSGYGEIAPYRRQGPSRAAKYGAVAVLMRSVTARSLRTVHTGALDYAADQPKIPAVAVSVEDSELLARLAAKGLVTVKLRMDPKMLPDAPSANVVAELRGRENPDEIVVIAAHIDSWDIGQGAHDDGAGVVTVMQAITLLKKLGLTPRRTIRVVLYTNEENGERGGSTYAKTHAAELSKHVLAIEHDSGAFAPTGFSVKAKGETEQRVALRLVQIGRLLAPLGMHESKTGFGGADIGYMVEGGVATAGLMTDFRTYFDVHHSDADTLDKVDPAILADDVGAMAAVAYIVADLPDRIDGPSAPGSATPF